MDSSLKNLSLVAILSASGFLLSCGQTGAQAVVTLDSLNAELTALKARVDAIETKVPFDLDGGLEGVWSASEYNMTSGSSLTQGEITINADSTFGLTISIGGPFLSLPCTSGSLTVESVLNLQSILSYNCGASGSGRLFVLDNRADGLLLMDIDDNVVLRLIGAAG